MALVMSRNDILVIVAVSVVLMILRHLPGLGAF
jgi:hypothetical protein